MNADTATVIADSSTISDKNLFAYCGNNLVMRADADGEFWHIVAGAAIGAVVCGLSSIISQAIAGEDINWTAVAISAASGAVSGAINAAFPCMGAIATGVVEGTLSAATYAATEKLAYGRDATWEDTLKVGLQSGIQAGCMKEIAQALGLCNCFVAGTLVATEIGYVTIENIKAGDLVWATDPDTGESALKPVVQTFCNETEEWIHVTVNGEGITCTPNHPFYSPVKGWTSAIDLKAGDILVMLNGGYVVVEQVQHELLESPETTYNFEVEGYHTYYVSGIGILVHNECPQKRGLARQKAEGMTNSKTININGNDRIPDYLNIQGKVLGEAKSVKYLYQSSQLTDIYTYGNQNGMKMFLKVEKFTRISGPLRTFLKNMGVSINVFRN